MYCDTSMHQYIIPSLIEELKNYLNPLQSDKILSWSVFKTLKKGLEGLEIILKPGRLLFPYALLKSSGQSLSWTTIMVHDMYSMYIILMKNEVQLIYKVTFELNMSQIAV